jgi:cell division protein FtsA
MSTHAMRSWMKLGRERLKAPAASPEQAAPPAEPQAPPAPVGPVRPRAHSGYDLVAAVDVGTSKICCFIARRDAGGRLRVAGIGHQVSHGMRNGTLVDMDAAEGSIVNAVHAAEQMADDTIRSIVVNMSGGKPASRLIGVEVDIEGHEVGDADLRRALEQTRQLPEFNAQVGSGRQFIHSIPITYSIDGNRGIRDPRGMFGSRLGVNMHVVTAASSAVRNLVTCFSRTHLDVHSLVVSPYASGLASLVDDEMDLGVTLVDMGAGTTSIAVFLQGAVLFTDIIGIGGEHVTKDIARGLSTSMASAERIKTLYGNALASPRDQREVIDVPQIGEEADGHVRNIPRSLLVGIIQPRLEETFELVRARLETSGFDKIAGRRVVLTGGAAQLPGTRELAALVLDKQAMPRASETALSVRLNGFGSTFRGSRGKTPCPGLSKAGRPGSLVTRRWSGGDDGIETRCTENSA